MECHILLVEDDTTARILLMNVLTRAGYEVTPAPDGETALELLERYAFDLILTDIQMLAVDGIQVLKAARLRPSPPVVILLTGHGTLETAIESLRAGASDYLLKPCSPAELLDRVARALQQRMREVQQAEVIRTVRALSQTLAQLPETDRTNGIPEQPRQPIEDQNGLEASSSVLRVGLLCIDRLRYTASFDGRQLHLTPIEYALLCCLAEARGEVIGYSEIVRRSHGHNATDTEAQSLLKAHIHNLRRKIDPSYLINVRGVGYRLAAAHEVVTGE